MIRRLWDGYWGWCADSGLLGVIVAQVVAFVFVTLPVTVVAVLALFELLRAVS